MGRSFLMFHIFCGFCKGRFPNFICCMKLLLMKQSVAPESTSAFVSAIALLVLIEMGICMDRNCVVTITELNLWTALTQADGFRRSENPLFRQGLLLPALVRLPLQWPFLEAMYRLVVVGFEHLFVLSLFALRCKCFCHQLLLRVLGFGMGSSFVGYYLVCSTYAESSCGSGVPFCDRYNTQLCVGPFVFLPLDFLA